MTWLACSILKDLAQKGDLYQTLWKPPQDLAELWYFTNLVGGWTKPSEEYARQIGNLPQVGVKIKNLWNHHLVT